MQVLVKTGLAAVLAVALAVTVGGCGKSDAKKSGEQEAVVLVNTAMYPLADMKNAKANGWPKRLEKVYVTSATPTNDMYPVLLADKKTKGFIKADHLFIGEKKIVTLTEKTEWFVQPDAQSHKKTPALAKGAQVLVIASQDGWVKINNGFGEWAEGWIKEGSFERGAVEVKTKDKELEVKKNGQSFKLRASSWLTEAEGYAFTPDQAMDGKLSTAWQEGKDDAGHGEWIEIECPNSSSWGVAIVNGFAHKDAKYGDLYPLNSRVKKVKVQLDGNDAGEVDLLDDNQAPQTVVKAGGKAFKTVRLAIVDTFSGSKWQDTSISEIEIQ